MLSRWSGTSVPRPRQKGCPTRCANWGLRAPERPLDAVCAGMALAEEPPGVDGVEVRRIETFEEHLAGLEIMLAAGAGLDPARRGRGTRQSAGDIRTTPAPRRLPMAGMGGGTPVAYGLAILRPPAWCSPEVPRSPRRAVEAATGPWYAHGGTKPSGWVLPAWLYRRSTARPRRSWAGWAFRRSRRSTPCSHRDPDRSPLEHSHRSGDDPAASW